jgi:Zn-dependent protease with chaperone function
VSELLKVVSLALVSFLLVNLAASAVSLALAQPWLEGRDSPSARRRARALFALCVLPAAASLVAVAAFFVPAYLRHEPPGAGEALGVQGLSLAATAALVVASALRRGFRSWRATRRLERAWSATARPAPLDAGGLPVFAIEHPFPVASVLGTRAPRLYLACQVVSALSEAELSAVLAHERAHVAARDNLRHWLIAASPDVLAWLPGRTRLERAWLAASEEAADEAVARRGPGAALDLAAALLKVARLVPAGRHAALPALALHGGDDLARRVRRLLAGSPAPAEPRPRITALLAAALILPAYAPSLRVVHELTERLVRLLS